MKSSVEELAWSEEPLPASEHELLEPQLKTTSESWC